MKKFDITIASLPDRENLVAEILYERMQWAEISQEADQVMIQFYAHPTQKYWAFPLDEALKVLEQAKQKFLGIGGYKR
jgi:hypothetical protein